jgi:hypothetical protein
MDHYWRRKLPSPADLFLQQELGVEPDLHDIQVQSAETYQLAEIAAGEPAQSEYDEEYGAKGIANQLHHMDENGSFSMADVARGT